MIPDPQKLARMRPDTIIGVRADELLALTFAAFPQRVVIGFDGAADQQRERTNPSVAR